MRVLMSDLLMKQIKFFLAFGIAVAWGSSNVVSAQVLNSFVERAKAQGGPLASVESAAVTDADATEEETEEAQAGGRHNIELS